jgi:hypothetical protein
MLKIRPEQYSALAETWLVEQIADHLAEFLPDYYETLRPAALREHIRDGIVRARGHGIDDGPTICLFVDLTFLFGPEFDREPWAAEILADRTLAGNRELRAGMLRGAAIDRLNERSAS